MVERVTLGQSSCLEYFGFALPVVIPPLLHSHSSVILGLHNRPISGHTITGLGLGLPKDLNTLLWLCT